MAESAGSGAGLKGAHMARPVAIRLRGADMNIRQVARMSLDGIEDAPKSVRLQMIRVMERLSYDEQLSMRGDKRHLARLKGGRLQYIRDWHAKNIKSAKAKLI